MEVNLMKARALSDKMFKSFKNGELLPLLQAVQIDDTLDFELRGQSANIYYRGGSLFRINERTTDYQIIFNKNYCTDDILPEYPNVDEAVKLIPQYKYAMDKWFHGHPKYEREFQQLLVRMNNSSGNISKSTDYYIADIEYADSEQSARFDIIAFKWLSTAAMRKNINKPSLSLIELKYGDGALNGKAGIIKHLEDLQIFINNEQQLNEFAQDMSKVFNQKCELGLIAGLQEHQFNVSINPNDVEVIFMFADHDPDKSVLKNIFSSINSSQYNFPIRIATASMIGCGLYANRMLTIEEFLTNV